MLSLTYSSIIRITIHLLSKISHFNLDTNYQKSHPFHCNLSNSADHILCVTTIS